MVREGRRRKGGREEKGRKEMKRRREIEDMVKTHKEKNEKEEK